MRATSTTALYILYSLHTPLWFQLPTAAVWVPGISVRGGTPGRDVGVNGRQILITQGRKVMLVPPKY